MFPVRSVVFLASLVFCVFSGELEYPKVRYCPVVVPCRTPLLYDVKHRCGIDEACPEGYKCCKNGCYIHKVCVVPVNKNGDQIPPPTRATEDPIDVEGNDDVKEWPKLSTQFTDKETDATLITRVSHDFGSTSETRKSTTITNDPTTSNDNHMTFDNGTVNLTTSTYIITGKNEQDSTPTDSSGLTTASDSQGFGYEITSGEQDENSTIIQETLSSSTIVDDYASLSTLANLVERTNEDFNSTDTQAISTIGDDSTRFSTHSNLLNGTSKPTGYAGNDFTSGAQDFTSTNVQETPSTVRNGYTGFFTLANITKLKWPHTEMESAENELTSGEEDLTTADVRGTPFYTGLSTLAKTTSKEIQVENSGNELTSGEPGNDYTRFSTLSNLFKETSMQTVVENSGNEVASGATPTIDDEALPLTTIGEYTRPSIFDNIIKVISKHIGWEGSGGGFTSDDEDLVDGSGEGSGDGSGMTEYVSWSTTDVANTPQTEFIDHDGGDSFTFEEVSTNPTLSTQDASGADATNFSTGSGIHSPFPTDDDLHFPDAVTEITGSGSTIYDSLGVATTTKAPPVSSEDNTRFPDDIGSSNGSTVDQTNSSTAGKGITFPPESTPTDDNHVTFPMSTGNELDGSGDDFNDTEAGDDDDEETTVPPFVSASPTNLTVKALPSHPHPVGSNDNVTYEEDDDEEDDDGVDEDIRNNFQGKTVRG